MGPDYIWRSARLYGGGDPMKAVPKAFDESRALVRTLIRASRVRAERHWKRLGAVEARLERRQACHELRQILEALGYGWYKHQKVVELPPNRWRNVIAPACWSRPEPISDRRWCRLPAALEPLQPSGVDKVRVAVIRAVAEALDTAKTDLNRAVLPALGPNPRVWGRTTSEIMVHVDMKGEVGIRPLVFNPLRLPVKQIGGTLKRRVRKMLAVAHHPLAEAGDALLADWCRAGFISSPAGAMISDASYFWKDTDGRPRGNDDPTVSLVPSNGVPVGVGIGSIQPGWVPIRIVFDHRAFDARASQHLHPFLERRVGELVEELL